MGNDNVLDQNEIERLLGGMGGGPPPPPPEPAPAAPAVSGGVLDQNELDALFGGASQSAAPAPKPAPAAPAPTSGGVLDQSEIESLMKGVSAAAPPPASPHPTPAPARPAVPAAPKPIGMGGIGGPAHHNPPAETDADEEGVPHGDIDYLLKRADDSLRSIATGKIDLPTEVIEFQFPEFGGTVPSSEHATLDQISEVELDVKIELGRTNMYLEDILKLRKGSVVSLDKMAGDAVDIYINGRLLARGEVLVMNENFCVRVAELLAGAIPME